MRIIRTFAQAYVILALTIVGCARDGGEASCGYHPNAASPTGKVCFENIAGLAVVEGDIVIGSVEELRRAGPRGAAVIAKGQHLRWPNAVVPYLKPPASIANCVRDAIRDFHDKTKLRFVELSSAPADGSAYVAFSDSGPGMMTFSLGRSPGVNTIFAPGCNVGPLIHEIGHVLGLHHEHNREDRDQYITMHWENIPAGRAIEYERQIAGYQDFGPYNYTSVMHYRPLYQSGKPRFSRKNGGGGFGGNALNDGDVAALNRLYGNFWEKPIFGTDGSDDILQPPVRVLSSTELEATVKLYSARRADAFLEYATSPSGPWHSGATLPALASHSGALPTTVLQPELWKPRLTGLQPNTRYYLRAWVRTAGTSAQPDCSNSLGAENVSACAFSSPVITTPIAAPAAPRSLRVSRSAIFLNVSWQAATGTPERHLVEAGWYAHNNGFTWRLLGTVEGNATSFEVLPPAAALLHFRVRAQNAGGTSDVSETATIDTSHAPVAPTALRFVSATTTSITVAWDHPGNNLTGFKVVQLSGQSSWELHLPIKADERQVTITGLSAGTSYRFQLKALNNTVASPLSNIVAPRTLSPIVTPSPSIRVTSSLPAKRGSNLAFSFSGAPNMAGQWVSLSQAGSAASAYKQSSPLAGTQGQGGFVLSRTLPAGSYVLRLYRDNGYTVIAEAGPFTISP